MMHSDFQNYIQEKNLFTNHDNILVTVSGGIDSVVLLNLLIKTGYRCGIAHCNFQLRGKESDVDEDFVQKISETYQIPFYNIRFDTLKYATSKGISTQMAARELRYQWFEQIRIHNNYTFIATGHNQNDNIETIFLNIIRGCSISGLTGIEVKNNKVVRPLLFATRSQIETYCKNQQLTFREDSSNCEIKYARNKLRNQIFPLLKEINPSLENTISENINRFIHVETIYNQTIKNIKKKLFYYKNNLIHIPISEFKILTPLQTYVYEIFKEFYFAGNNIASIISLLDAETGKYIDSKTHRLLKNRDHLILSENKIQDTNEYNIFENDVYIEKPLNINISKYNYDNKEIEKNKNTALFDAEKLIFPLQIRKWQEGDYFFPLGMNNKKKLSDYFIDKKFSLFEKQNIWLLLSENKIAWIIGERLDNRFRVTSDTRKIIQLTIEQTTEKI